MPTKKVLVVADESEQIPGPAALRDLAPDLVLSCGDLPFECLEAIVDVCDVPLLYVPGNHDPALTGFGAALPAPPFLTASSADPPGPRGCVNVDGTVEDAAGVRVAGLGGSVRYRSGPNQYTQWQMKIRCLSLEARERARRRRPDILLTHAPPLGIGDDDDAAHQGFAALHRLIRVLAPPVHVHGHVHPHGPRPPDRKLRETCVINAVGHRILSIDVDSVDRRVS
jgi:hypothetical protein